MTSWNRRWKTQSYRPAAMSKIYKLHNQIKHYEWGSMNTIPDFLGSALPEIKEGTPCAEMWMGTHAGAPSQIELPQAPEVRKNLSDIAGELPFLFKILAVDKPLSIQAHPNKKRAEEGFANEEEAGISLHSPKRNYKDRNHKPEIVCALSRFTLMAGFRENKVIYNMLEEFIKIFPQLKEIITPLLRSLNTDTLAVFFRILFGFSNLEKEYISSLILEQEPVIDSQVISNEQWGLIKSFTARYPLDTAILSPLYLNLITLNPSQAVFIPSGIFHAYLNGFAVELMASSDNVLRGGLTPKYVDIPQLMSILDFSSYMPQVITPVPASRFTYPVECDDFALTFVNGKGIEGVFDKKGPGICLVTEGELIANGIPFKKGESFFVPQENNFVYNGNFSAFFASSAVKI